MSDDHDADFDAMTDLCIEGCRKVLSHGSPEMQTAARLLLNALAHELVRRGKATRPELEENSPDREKFTGVTTSDLNS